MDKWVTLFYSPRHMLEPTADHPRCDMCVRARERNTIVIHFILPWCWGVAIAPDALTQFCGLFPPIFLPYIFMCSIRSLHTWRMMMEKSSFRSLSSREQLTGSQCNTQQQQVNKEISSINSALAHVRVHMMIRFIFSHSMEEKSVRGEKSALFHRPLYRHLN